MNDHVEFPIEEIFEEGPSRSQRKKNRRRDRSASPDNNFVLKEIQPKTENQAIAFDEFDDGKHLILQGVSGTGKTFIAAYLAISAVMTPGSRYEKVIIVRSAVPSRQLGFMPGGPRDKVAMYEIPYHGHFADFYGRADAYTVLKNKKIVDFISTSFVRGITIENAVIIIDEPQNMTDMELHSVITRLGKNTRLILAGDFRQDDLTGQKGEVSGFKNIVKILSSMKSVATIDFQIEDVVRSGFVKEYLLKRHNMGFDPPV